MFRLDSAAVDSATGGSGVVDCNVDALVIGVHGHGLGFLGLHDYEHSCKSPVAGAYHLVTSLVS